MGSYKDLSVWNKSIVLVSDIYLATEQFPKKETFGLASQIRRASVSIPSNLAEGSARKSIHEFRRFINIALGSAAEVETQLCIAEALNYLNSLEKIKLSKQVDEIGRMLIGLSKSISNKF